MAPEEKNALVQKMLDTDEERDEGEGPGSVVPDYSRDMNLLPGLTRWYDTHFFGRDGFGDVLAAILLERLGLPPGSDMRLEDVLGKLNMSDICYALLAQYRRDLLPRYK